MFTYSHAPLAAFLALSFVWALQPIPFANASESDGLDARVLAQEWAASAALEGSIAFPDALEFEIDQVLPWAAGTHVRLRQVLMGLPVYKKSIILSYDQEGQLVRSRGEAVSGVLLDPHPTVSSEFAEAAVVHALRLMNGSGQLWPARSELMVYVLRDGTPRIAWAVDASVKEPLGTYQVLVDAHSGAFLEYQPTLWTAQANVYPTNPAVSSLGQVELQGIEGEALRNTYANVRSCLDWNSGDNECEEKGNYASPDSDGNWLFTSAPTQFDDPLAEVQMFYHLDLIARWFEDRFGFQHDFYMTGQAIEGIVNFEYANAFWGDADGDGVGEVAFGQTAFVDFGYDADVIYHEFGHSVFGKIVDPGFIAADEYGLEWAGGGLNEGTADLFALILTGDPNVGEYAGAGFGYGNAPIRALEEDRKCPTDLYGESHRDGEIWGALGWNLIDDERVGADVTADLLYGALATWPSDVNWQIAGESLVEIAGDLLSAGEIDQAAYDAILEHGTASGVIGCGRVISLDNEEEPTLYMVHVGWLGEANIPLGNQFSIEAPETAYRLRFRIKEFSTNDWNLGWRLYMRRGDFVEHELENFGFGGIEVPVPEVYDETWDGEDDFELELTLDSDPPLEPGATYYFSIASNPVGNISQFAGGEVRVDADVWVTEAEEPAAEDEASGAGCACAGTAASLASGKPEANPSFSLLLILAAGLGLRRRRL